METLKVQVQYANEIANVGILLVKSGKIRNHKLGSSSRIHTGEVEKKEYQIYRDFLISRNGYMVYELTGNAGFLSGK